MTFRRSSSSLLVALVFGMGFWGSYHTFLAPPAFITPPTPPGQKVMRRARAEVNIGSSPVTVSTDAQTEDAVEDGMIWGYVVGGMFGFLCLLLSAELINNGLIQCLNVSGATPTCVVIPAGLMVWKWAYALKLGGLGPTAVAVMTPEARDVVLSATSGIGAAAWFHPTAGIAADATLSSTAATVADVAGIVASAQPLEATAGIAPAAEVLNATAGIAAGATLSTAAASVDAAGIVASANPLEATAGIVAAAEVLNAAAGIAGDATLSSTAATAADVAGIASSAQSLEATSGIVAAVEPLKVAAAAVDVVLNSTVADVVERLL